MFTSNQSSISQAYYNVIAADFKTDVLLGTNDVVKNNFSIFPNPNKGSFAIQFDTEIDNFSVQIMDMLGRTVLNQNFNLILNQQQDVQLNSSSKGLFFVKIKNGNSVSIQKMIIE